MVSSNRRELVLERLSEKAYAITPAAVGFYKEQCMVCFHKNGHSAGVMLQVTDYDVNDTFAVYWTGEVTERMLTAYVDHNKLVDFGACTIALLLVPEITEYVAIEPAAATGTGIDYYLAPHDQDDILIFNRAARLEVSGILKETPQNSVSGRIRVKQKRLDRLVASSSVDSSPVFIVIVEFSQPRAQMVER